MEILRNKEENLKINPFQKKILSKTLALSQQASQLLGEVSIPEPNFIKTFLRNIANLRIFFKNYLKYKSSSYTLFKDPAEASLKHCFSFSTQMNSTNNPIIKTNSSRLSKSSCSKREYPLNSRDNQSHVKENINFPTNQTVSHSNPSIPLQYILEEPPELERTPKIFDRTSKNLQKTKDLCKEAPEMLSQIKKSAKSNHNSSTFPISFSVSLPKSDKNVRENSKINFFMDNHEEMKVFPIESQRVLRFQVNEIRQKFRIIYKEVQKPLFARIKCINATKTNIFNKYDEIICRKCKGKRKIWNDCINCKVEKK